ncbi:hypothetical protein [Sphingomonas nostoxanthinifaciens]|uniref:hypothetical protein n=1 Tax=Sphingomonas nostoxanthinifaciens TaxID=2872652 RepID=UPI001CC1C7AF|nr:hypothetical protein [Sphingomonas nostoxanthinifaciens]UAK23429.1 hypothetical protein K8P63_13620 [Sphingomonas nostoxanthinifaciens]
MAQPPNSQPSSDIEGVNRDARAGKAATTPHPDPGGAIDNAKNEGKARPEETPPLR